MLTPVLLIVVGLFLGGLFLALIQSIGYLPVLGRTTLSLSAYHTLFSQTSFWRSLGVTVWIGSISTLISTLLAILFAITLHRPLYHSRSLLFLFQLNIPIPHLVGGIGMLLLLGQSGLLARMAYNLGWIRESAAFPILIEDRYAVGIIAHYVWKSSCFIGITLLAALRVLDQNLEAAAITLGATRWQTFRHITFPLITPALYSSSVLVFAFIFGSFEVPYLLGRRFPSTLPVLAYRAYTDVNLDNRPLSMAINIIITIISFLFILLYRRLLHTAQPTSLHTNL